MLRGARRLWTYGPWPWFPPALFGHLSLARAEPAKTAHAAMFGPNYGAAQSHIGELMQEREDFIQASKAQARRVAELEASLAAATELHGAAQVPRPPPRSLPVLPHLHRRTPHRL